MITSERLRELLHYDTETGVFTWKVHRMKRVAGKRAGCLAKHGYILIRVERVLYAAHRLAWLYMMGEWPDTIDHIDGKRANNAWGNLRNGSQALNTQNIKAAQVNNESGRLGVWQDKSCHSRYVAQIMVNGKAIRVGRFSSADEAHAAYVAAKRLYHEGCTI
jgi:hypothetical protein